ncbi:hypothetical protein CcaCcLH18_00741 [Colletotrichum camelliae]|nr:hypothetical protein CcaCcLH18_00741 [Colletotrichum camelliae]
MNITYSNTNPRREPQQTTTARTFYGIRAAEYPSTMAASWPSGETSQAYHFTHSQSADCTPNTPVRWTESETEHHVRYPRLKAQEMEPVDPISRLQAKLQDYVEKLREEQRYSASLEKDLKQLERKAMIEREDLKVHRKARTSQQFKREIADNKRCIDKQAEEIRTQQAYITRLQYDYNTKSNETDTLAKDLKKARQSLDFLDGKLRTAETNFQHAPVRTQELQQEKQQAEQTHIQNMNLTFERIQKLEDELENSRRNYEEQRAADTAQHASIIEEAQLRHAERLSQMEDNHSKVVKELSSKIASKDSRIAAYSSNGNYKPIHDGVFRQTLQSLSQQVKNLTLHVPRTDKITVGNELDRTGYLGRSAQQKSRGWQNLVISICWDIIIRGFFAFPLGFGSLGSQGEGFQMLVKFYQVFARPDSDGPTSNSSSFPTDKETNLGRAWLFNGILQGVRSNAVREGYIATFDENVFCVSEELTETLERLSSRQLDPQALALIKNLARECGVLALEMGAQRAQVTLESCQYGDMITPVIDRWLHYDRRSVPLGYIIAVAVWEFARVGSAILLLWGTYLITWREMTQRVSKRFSENAAKYWWSAAQAAIFVVALVSLFYVVLNLALAIVWMNFLSLNIIGDIATKKKNFEISTAVFHSIFALLTAIAGFVTFFIKAPKKEDRVPKNSLFVFFGAIFLLVRSVLEIRLSVTEDKQKADLARDISYGLVTCCFFALMYAMARVMISDDSETVRVIEASVRKSLIERL